MEWPIRYQHLNMTAREAVSRYVKSGNTVTFGGGCFPGELTHELMRQIKADKLRRITLVGTMAIKPFDELFDPSFIEKKFRYTSFFHGDPERRAAKVGTTSFVPMQYNIFGEYLRKLSPDVAFVMVTPPDSEGYCNLGPMAPGVNCTMVRYAKKIVAQVNAKQPRVYGKEVNIHVSDIEAFVPHDEELTVYQTAETSETDIKIASNIIDLIPDGACLQIGIGGVANAVGYGLKGKKHLGIHTEMYTESMMELQKTGVIDNSRKTLNPGVSLAGFAMGKKPLYAFTDKNPQLYFAPFDYVNDVNNIAANDNMVSINTAISIDLTGQVCSESIGFYQFSGTGGQVDFVRGATKSKGGKSFFCVSSTVNTKDGKKSRFVLSLAPGSAVTTLRAEVMYVATEYGCVNLWGEDIPTRAKRLISIAHPEFRDELKRQAKEAGLLY
jgi:acyl-CoA hydrolase